MEGFFFLFQFFAILGLQKKAEKSTITALCTEFVKTQSFLHQEQDFIKNYIA